MYCTLRPLTAVLTLILYNFAPSIFSNRFTNAVATSSVRSLACSARPCFANARREHSLVRAQPAKVAIVRLSASEISLSCLYTVSDSIAYHRRPGKIEPTPTCTQDMPSAMPEASPDTLSAYLPVHHSACGHPQHHRQSYDPH